MSANKKPNKTKEEMRAIVSDLLDESIVEGDERRLARGAMSRVAGKHDLTTRRVSQIWKKAKECRKQHINIHTHHPK